MGEIETNHIFIGNLKAVYLHIMTYCMEHEQADVIFSFRIISDFHLKNL